MCSKDTTGSKRKSPQNKRNSSHWSDRNNCLHQDISSCLQFQCKNLHFRLTSLLPLPLPFHFPLPLPLLLPLFSSPFLKLFTNRLVGIVLLHQHMQPIDCSVCQCIAMAGESRFHNKMTQQGRFSHPP